MVFLLDFGICAEYIKINNKNLKKKKFIKPYLMHGMYLIITIVVIY